MALRFKYESIETRSEGIESTTVLPLAMRRDDYVSVEKECKERSMLQRITVPSNLGQIPGVRRFRATDLGLAQRIYRRQKDHDSHPMYLEVDVVIGPTNKDALRRATSTGSSGSSSGVRYVGTLAGFVAFVSDICTAGVADGVIVMCDADDVLEYGLNELVENC